MAVQLDLADIQGLFARGYSKHRYARFTVFAAREPDREPARCSNWLLPAGHDAAPFSGDVAVQVAFTRPACAGWACRTGHGRIPRRVHSRA